MEIGHERSQGGEELSEGRYKERENLRYGVGGDKDRN